jgi:hypothetical protein
MKRKKIWIMTALMVIFVAGVPSTMAVKPVSYEGEVISGYWKDTNGATYHVRKDGNVIVWYGSGKYQGRFWHHIGSGTIQGNVIQATFRDLPRSTWPTNKGSMRGVINSQWNFVDWDRIPDWRR